MSDTAPACPKCGWARAAILATQAHAQHGAQKDAQRAEGQKLVNKSTQLMALGFAFMLGGCGVTVGFQAGGVPAIIGIGLGLAVLRRSWLWRS